MPPTDPREEYDDVLEWHVEEAVGAEEFGEHREMEAFRSGWVAVGYVFDDDGRLLLAYEEDPDDGGEWLAPGGTVQPGESLAEGLVREVREETEVEVSVERPHGIADVVVRNGDETTSFSVVSFEATAESTEVGDDLGLDDEAIVDADWFEELPGDLYNRGGTEEILEACERWEWSEP